MLTKTLRDDQAMAIHNVREAVKHGERRIVVQGPTGMGKGLLIADIVDRALLKDKRVLITVPAISLVDQCVTVLANEGVREVGVIQAQHPMTDWSRPVQVCSVQTLTNRWKEQKMPEADLVLVDEVHRWFTLFPKWMCDIKWQHVPFIGFSATPWVKGLGTLYKKLIVANTIDDLIAQTTLVPFRTFAPDAPDLSGVSIVAGEFAANEIEEIMRPKKLVANVVETWLALANGRPTVCFCCSRAHADQVAKEFESKGVGAGYMDCDTPQNERARIRERMLAGEIKVVTNVEIVGIGIDWPEVSCIIYARPTMSDMRFTQNIGRGLRSFPGKTDCLILDHSTTTMRLGFVNEIYSFHKVLDDGKAKKETKAGVLLPKECTACHYLKPPRTATCPNCGFKMEAHAGQVAVERGTLREIKATNERAVLVKALPDKAHVYGQLLWYAKNKGYKEGWAAVKYQDIFEVWPRGLQYEDKISAPVPALFDYIYRATLRWKKQMQNAKGTAQRQEVSRRHDAAPAPRTGDAVWATHPDDEDLVGGTFCTEQDLKDFV